MRRYQKARVVTIIAAGRSTAEPANPAPHWRDRPLGMASVALKLADMGEPGSADAIRALSVRQGRTVPDVVIELLHRGLSAARRELAV